MSLYGAMFTGISGLNANSQELGVVSDNIANANTIGFKGSRAAFEDMLGGAQVGSGSIGLGTRLQAVQRLLTQGALTSTGLATDLALKGDGFFVVKGADGQRFFTRAGQFTLDDDGYLVNLDGLRVQGYAADVQGNLSGLVSDLDVGDASAPPVATTQVVVRGNLDATAVDSGIAYDPNDPDSYDFSTSTVVYDSLGNAHEATVQYKKTANPGEWEVHVVVDGGSVAGGTAGTLVEIDSGTLTFDTNGALTGQTMTGAPGFTPVGAAGPQAITLDLSAMTQYAGPSATSFLSQDGSAAGELAGIQIDDQGNVVGAFTNGETRVLGAVAVADFAAPDALRRLGSNLLGLSPDAGEPNIGTAGTGGRGTIIAGALEQSNVDLASEFVRMIVAQRGFQANSKAVTTADSLLGELMQLKR